MKKLIVIALLLFAVPAFADTQTRYPTVDDTFSGTWTVFPTSPTTKYDKVDEAVADDANTYIKESTVNANARFTFPVFSIPDGATNISITITCRKKRGASGSYRDYALLVVNGTDYVGSTAWNNTTSYANYSNTFDTNPCTGIAWTVTDINGIGTNPLQSFGLRASGDGTYPVYITQIYAVVTYTPPPPPGVYTQIRYPTGDGTTKTGTWVPASNLYLNVDDPINLPDDATTQLYTTNTGAQVGFTIAPFDIPANAVVSDLTLHARARISTGTFTPAIYAVINGQQTQNYTETAGTNYTDLNVYWPYWDYDRGIPWTSEILKGITELGFGLGSDYAVGTKYLTQIYAVVTYTLPDPAVSNGASLLMFLQ